MRYRVKVTEFVQPATSMTGAGFVPAVDGATIFETTIDHRPDLVKLSEAVKPPRIRKSRAKTA